MTGRAAGRTQAQSPQIRVDEAGIHTGVWGAFRLKSVFQPVYLRNRAQLIPFAVEGRSLPHLDGAAMAEAFRRSVPDEELPALDRLDRALHVGNLDSLLSPGFQLFVSLDVRRATGASAVAEEVEAMLARMAAADIEASRVVWVLRGHDDIDAAALTRYVDVVRSAGMMLATDECAPVFTSPERLSIVRPDYVRMAAARLEALADAAVFPLVKTMVSVLRERGARVWVTGVGRPAELELALDAGADCLQGVLLAAPGLAGTLLDLPPIDADRLRSRIGKVVPLFG